MPRRHPQKAERRQKIFTFKRLESDNLDLLMHQASEYVPINLILAPIFFCFWKQEGDDASARGKRLIKSGKRSFSVALISLKICTHKNQACGRHTSSQNSSCDWKTFLTREHFYSACTNTVL